jgi:hypothetical protein
MIVDELIVVEKSLVITADLPSLNSQLIVPNLNVITTKVDLLLAGISRRAPLPLGLPMLSIRSTSFDKTVRRERIFAIVFPILYLIGHADFNAA